MIRDLLAVHALLWVSDEKLADEVFGLSGDRLPGRRVEVVVASLDLFEECEVIFIVEGRASRQQDE